MKKRLRFKTLQMSVEPSGVMFENRTVGRYGMRRATSTTEDPMPGRYWQGRFLHSQLLWWKDGRMIRWLRRDCEIDWQTHAAGPHVGDQRVVAGEILVSVED